MRRFVLLALLVVASVATPADADEPSNDGDPHEPRPTSVHARLDGPRAHLTVRFVLTAQRGYNLNSASLGLPHHAVVTGATATVGGVAHPLALTTVAAADQAWETITTGAPGHDEPWAIKLGSSSPETLEVELAAPRPGRVVLDVELEAATCFARDARWVELPETWHAALEPALRRGPPAPEDELHASCGDISGPWLALPARELAGRPYGEQRIAGVAGRLAVGDHHVARVELDLAGQISEVPADLATVLVIDASRSLQPDEVEAQRAIVAAYLRAAPLGRVQVIAYARTAQPLLPGWMTAAQAAPRIDRAIRGLALRNGSNLDAGLAEATRWLVRTTGTRRIVLFSDQRLADRLSESVPAIGKAVPAGIIIQVVVPVERRGELGRDDEALLAPVATATTGIAVQGALDEQGHVDATMLVRPISLDHLKLTARAWEPLVSMSISCSEEGSLPEGTSCQWWGTGTAVSGPIAIEGALWSRKVVRYLRPDLGQARTLARLLSAARGVDAALEHEVDRLALAVNPVWSLWGTWGGKAGYSDDNFGFGRSGFGGCGCDGIGDIGHGSRFGTLGVKLDLRDQLAAGIAACKPGDAKVELTIETTFLEIVDVRATVTPEAPGVRECITEVAWGTMLAMPTAPSHALTRVTF